MNVRPLLFVSVPCEGVRAKPLERINPAPSEWRGSYARHYGIAHCAVCRRWFAAHQDGTPVFHKRQPIDAPELFS